jgi:hypothetical protein
VSTISDGVSQYRFYKNPVTKREYLYGEESVIESDRIDKKIENHIGTPFGDGDVKEDIVSLSTVELALRHQRCIVSSTNRTKNMVYNYARGDVWNWFITLTFNKNKINRYSFEECSKRLRKWLNNMKNIYAPDMKYLVVPEQHKDGAWHFHGLLSNTGAMVFNKDCNKYTGELLETKSGLQIYNFGNYKMGFSTATPITDTAKASSYITKYITKDLSQNTKGFRRIILVIIWNYPQNLFFLIKRGKGDFS